MGVKKGRAQNIDGYQGDEIILPRLDIELSGGRRPLYRPLLIANELLALRQSNLPRSRHWCKHPHDLESLDIIDVHA